MRKVHKYRGNKNNCKGGSVLTDVASVTQELKENNSAYGGDLDRRTKRLTHDMIYNMIYHAKEILFSPDLLFGIGLK